MNFFKKYKNIILFLIISILIIVGYLFFFDNSTEEEVISNQSIENEYFPETENIGVEKEILNLLLRMDSIELDNEVFSDPVFKTLQDNSKNIIQEPVGKENPFSSI